MLLLPSPEACKALNLWLLLSRYTCTSQFAKARTTAKGKLLPACVAPTAYANGSALVFYNSTSYRDDMVWAAAWLYKATGERVSFYPPSQACSCSACDTKVPVGHSCACACSLTLHSVLKIGTDVWKVGVGMKTALKALAVRGGDP